MQLELIFAAVIIIMRYDYGLIYILRLSHESLLHVLSSFLSSSCMSFSTILFTPFASYRPD